MANIVGSVLDCVPPLLFAPAAYFLLALLLRFKLAEALKNALMIGCGLVSVIFINNYMLGLLLPMSAGFASGDRIALTGMSTWFASIISLPFFVLIYGVGIAVNYLMLRLKLTRTVNVDFLNYFCFLNPAIPVWLHTRNAFLCLLIFACFFAVNLKIADWTAPMVQDYYQVDGVSIVHHASGFQAVYCIPINWVLDHIPGINRINFTIDDMQRRLGLLSEPAVISFLLGAGLALAGNSTLVNAGAAGLSMAAITLLLPKAIGVLMEGLTAINTRMRDFITAKVDSSEVLMGVDGAILSGYPEVVSLAAIWTPIYVLLHFLLPWSNVIPGPETLSVGMMIAIVLPFAGAKGAKGNMFRALVILFIFTGVILFIAGYVAPYVTEFYQSGGMISIPEGMMVSSSGTYHAQYALSYYLFHLIGIA